MSLEHVEMKAADFADKRKILVDQVALLQDKIDLLKREYLPQIKLAAEDLAISHAALHEQVNACPELFEKPKTQTFYGIRVGFKKQKGKIEIPDEDATIRLIKKILTPEEVEQVIDVKEKVLKTPLENLPAATIKRLGVTIHEDTDEVYIKAIGDDIDKFVAALLDEAESLLKEVA